MSINWRKLMRVNRAVALQPAQRNFRVSRLRILAAFVPLVLYVLAMMNYVILMVKYRIHPGFPRYSDPVGAVLGTLGLSFAGVLTCGPLWFLDARPKWVLVIGGVLCAILLTIFLVVFVVRPDIGLLREIRRYHCF